MRNRIQLTSLGEMADVFRDLAGEHWEQSFFEEAISLL